MIIHTHHEIVPLKRNQTVRIIAFSDVHYGAEGCAANRFEEDVIRKFADDPSAYYLGIGDMYDAITPKDVRHRISEAGSKYRATEAVLDDVIKDFTHLFKKNKIPKERILGFGVGNHEDDVLRRYGTDLIERTCYELGVKNLGYSFFLRLLTSAKIPLVIFGSHGFGGSTRTDGADITKYVRHCFRHPGASVYLYGHSHQKWSKRVSVVKPDFGRRIQNDSSIIVGATGSWLKTYGHYSTPTYSERWGCNPIELGNLVVEATYKETDRRHPERFTKKYLDYRVVE